jgi:hypothetical protein
MSITKNVLLNWYFLMKKKLRKIRMIFDIKIDFESQILALFDSSPLIQNSKFNNFFWVCWFLGKHLSNFVSSVWKLHNQYCHKGHQSGGYFTSSVPQLSPMFSISQNPAKDQAFAALPPVAALYSQQVKIHPEAAEILMHLHLY